jgi:hypothetical protein
VRAKLLTFRKSSRLAGGGDASHSWRDFFKVHPACDAWPELPADERKALKADIEANFVKVPIQTRQVTGESATYVIDGRTRLDLVEELGRQVVNAKGDWIGALAGKVEHRGGRTHEEVALEVISYNGKRRHMTKQGLAECIVGTLKAVRTLGEVPVDGSPKGVSRQVGGKLPIGRPIDRFKVAAVERSKQAGISRRTVERVLSKAKPATPATPRKPKPPVDKLKPEYVHRKFGQFLRHWPSHTDQRKVRKVVHEFTA